jgi:hypothetical protein
MKNYTTNEQSLLSYLENLKEKTELSIQRNVEMMESIKVRNFLPTPSEEVIQSYEETNKKLIFRSMWLESQINQISELV